MSDVDLEKVEPQEIWVNVTEAAQMTGYSRDRVQRIAYNNWNLPEAEREITVERRSRGYMIWLPSLLKYADRPGKGPQPKRKQSA
jgi:hypothetical protein